VTLCVLLWANEGCESLLIDYEDQVLALVAAHGGSVRYRARTTGAPGEPLEVHLIEFPSEGDLEGYMHDERRLALAEQRDRAIARTEVLRVELV
jgi:uncharacterized protein (DUF1330 family)